jgi:hypothetical protein
VLGFEMPGTAIPDFAHHAKGIARAGIYDLGVHHDAILRPVVLGHWDEAGSRGLTRRPRPLGADSCSSSPGWVGRRPESKSRASRSVAAAAHSPQRRTGHAVNSPIGLFRS